MAAEYVRHFGLRETPFGRNHDPKWLYLSGRHQEAMQQISRVVAGRGGPALIRGDVGHGKSFLIEYLMTAWPQQFGRRCAKLQNTGTIAGPRALMTEILAAFGLEPSGSVREMRRRLKSWLRAKAEEDGQPAALFIDEAQSLGSEAIPALCDLIDLKAGGRRLLRIVLSAQLNIDRKLVHFPALQNRIASVFTFEPLSMEEMEGMLRHRFCAAGAMDVAALCPPETMCALYRVSGGVPRDILVLTESTMKEAYLQNSARLLPVHVAKAARDLACRCPHLAKAA